MKASERKIIELFATANTQFTIPVYQRDYNWQEKHCQRLFNDIERLSNALNIDSHFIGSIVYIHEGVYKLGINQLDIIDGQQRMTTLTLLFLALYYRLKELGNERKCKKIYNQYIVDEYMESDIILKLIPPEENLKLLEKISKNEKLCEIEEYKDRNIIKNFLYFKEKIKNYSEEEMDKFLTGIEKLIYVDIALEKGKDDPQKIFESLNSTGLDLSQGDLIRNYILMGLKRDEQNKIYKDIWLTIENNCKLTDGEKIINYVSDFMRDYLTIKNNKISVKNKVFEDFKSFYSKENITNYKILYEMKELSAIYNLIICPEREKDEEIKKQLNYLKTLDQTIINPFLISVLKDYKNEKIIKETLIQILELLQSYLWRRYIVGIPSNSLNKIFMSLYSKIDSQKYYESFEKILVNQNFPEDEELKLALKLKPIYKDKEKTEYVLERLENSCHNELVDFKNKKITIEHIFPQNPSKEWKDLLSKEEIEEMTALKDTLSNLTLTGSNQNLSNKSFLEKRNESIHGYKDSKLYLNSWLGEQTEWNITKMRERFGLLFENVIKIWKKPKIKEENSMSVIFSINGKKSFARGLLLENKKFLVLKGSTAVKEFAQSVKDKNERLLEKFKEEEILGETIENYIFEKDTIFISPSGAAEFILGRSINGWAQWETFEGKKLNEFKK